MEELDKILIEADARSKSNTKRLDDLQETTKLVREMATSVAMLVKSVEAMQQGQEKQEERLRELESKPAQQWNTMTRTIFTSLVSTLSGGILGALVALLLK